MIEDVIKRIKQLNNGIIAIDGESGSGKTMIASMIKDKLGDDCEIVDLDWFLPGKSKLLNPPIRLITSRVIDLLEKYQKSQDKLEVLCHDCSKDNDYIKVIHHKRYLIIEGCYALTNIFSKYVDLKLFVKASVATCDIRRSLRKDDFNLRYHNYWEKDWKEYLELEEPMLKADMVIENE